MLTSLLLRRKKGDLVYTRILHWPPVLFTLAPCCSFVEPESNTLSTLHKCNLHILVGLLRSQWWRSVARWKGAAFNKKMNVELEDEEFAAVDVESRGSEPNKQSNDPPHEFTGTKPSELKSYRKEVKQWLLFTRTPAQWQEPRVVSRLTGTAWDACDGLEPEDVATDDGVNVILDTLAAAFQGERETELNFYGPGRNKGERLHDYTLRVQSNVRELAKQRVRLPELLRGDLSTQARIAIMTLAGNSLSFSDVRKACKRYADEFLRDPKEHDAHKSHNLCVTGKRSKGYSRGTGRRHCRGNRSCGPERGYRHRFGRNRCSRDTAGLQGVATAAWRTTSNPWLQGL